MNTTNKLTITLSPEEVKVAIENFVLEHRIPVHIRYEMKGLEVHFNVAMQSEGYGPQERDYPAFTGATVEVTQP